MTNLPPFLYAYRLKLLGAFALNLFGQASLGACILVSILSLTGRQEQCPFTTRLRALKLIHSWYAGKNGRDDFVVAGAKTLRYLLRRQRGLSLASDEHHLVAYSCLEYLRDINHALIHADAPQDRCLLLVNQHAAPVGRRPPEAIRHSVARSRTSWDWST